jgi:hypothetical protein
MRFWHYLALALVAFLVATTAADVYARVTIGAESFGKALGAHLYWAGVQFVGTLMLLMPFGFLAVIGAWVNDRTSQWKGVAIFSVPTLYLIYSYFEGYHASREAVLDERWTAATLSVGFLPFSAAPIVLIAWLAGLIVTRLNQRKTKASVRSD